MDIFKKTTPFFLTLILSLPAIWVLFGNGYFPMHDDTQVARVYEMTAALREGQFPVRWVRDLGYGYGYPIFNFYAPLPYYVGGFIHFVGIDIIAATKIMFGLGILLSAISMFLLGKAIWGVRGGIISAIFYVYAPYHAVQVYVRGAVGEYWAYGFLPLLFLGLYVLSNTSNLREKNIQGIIYGVLGYTGVMLSHNITILVMVPFLFLWLLSTVFFLFITEGKSGYSSIRWYSFNFISFMVLGLGLSAFFWLPAIIESSSTRVQTLIEGTNNFRDHFVYLDQLWDSPWGYGGSAIGRDDGMSFKIGKLHIMTAIAGLLLLLYTAYTSQKTGNLLKEKFAVILMTILSILFSVFMMLSASKPVWELMPIFSYVQYPWRFLVFCLLFTSLLAGSLIYVFDLESTSRKFALVVGGSVAILLLVLNNKYFQPKYLYSFADVDITPETIVWKYSRISDEYLPKNFPIPETFDDVKKQILYSDSDIIIKDQQIKSHFWDMTISAKKDAEILFRLAYFPGWQMYIDTQKTTPAINNGLLALSLPKGDHRVKLVFENTLVRQFGNFISILSLVLVAILYILYRQNMYEKK